MLMVIKASMFSLIKKDEIKTKPTAPSARTIVHKKIDRFQLAPDLHKVPIVKPTIPCLSRYVKAFTGPDKTSKSTVVATRVFLPASTPHLIEDITIGNEKKQLK